MAKPLDQLTKAEIERLRDKLAARQSASTKALIAAGHGSVKCRDIWAQARANPGANPLYDEELAAHEALSTVYTELDARKRYHGTHHRIIKKAGGLW